MTPPQGLYERVLAAGGGEMPRPAPPRTSAAVVFWRRRAGRLEVYWLRRGRSLPFMGGWLAFPGGALERRDSALPIHGEPSGCSAETIHREVPDRGDDNGAQVTDLVPGLVGAALREAFEETGLLVADGARPGRDAAIAARRRLAERSFDFARWLGENQLAFDASRLVFAGRWLTPPMTPVRFDNRFFLCEWSAELGEPAVEPPESESGEWIEPERALEQVASGGELAAPPILHILRVLAEDGPDRGVARLRDTAEANLGPLRRLEFRPGLLAFPLAAATLPPATHTNAFVVGRGDCILVDPGSPFERENDRLLAALSEAERRLGRRVVAIWLTHHHPDHVAGVEALRRALGVPVAAHAAAAARLAEIGIAVDRTLGDGEIVELAGRPPIRIRILHAPGHTRGHLCFEIDGAGDVLSGDLVAGFSTIVIDPPEGDMTEYLSSLERVIRLGPRALFPSHGAPIGDAVAKLEEVRAHRLAREAQVLSQWESGVREPAAMIPAVYADVPPAIHPLAERQIVAHLDRLRAFGRIA